MIRRAQESDAEVIAGLDGELFHELCWNEAFIRREIALGWGLVVTGEKGRVRGYLLIRFDGDLGDIIRVGIVKKHQRKGYGRALLKYAIEELNSLLMLTVKRDNEPARKLYMSEGFEPIASVDNAIILMRAQA